MNKGIEIARGKTKVLYESLGQPDQLVVMQTDAISAGDGARRHQIAGKGRLAAQTTARVFRLLNLCGLPTHYLSGGEDDDQNEMLVRRCNMIPLEVVVRGAAAGSFAKRHPGIAQGSMLMPRVIEFFFKDDAAHDPLITNDQIVERGLASPVEVGAMTEIARLAFEMLAHAWRRRDTLLVDLKVEFGRLAGGENQGQLVLADVVDNDAWRIWPQGRQELMLDKQLYRNLPEVDDAALARVKEAYEEVADIVGSFPQMRPGMVAMFADDQGYEDRFAEVAAALGQFGIPSMRRVASAVVTPGYALQIVGQFEAAFARLLYVALGDPMLYALLDHATTAPVVDGNDDPPLVALRCAKLLGLDDTVLFGRTLLAQANRRSMVLAADAALQVPAPPGAAFA